MNDNDIPTCRKNREGHLIWAPAIPGLPMLVHAISNDRIAELLAGPGWRTSPALAYFQNMQEFPESPQQASAVTGGSRSCDLDSDIVSSFCEREAALRSLEVQWSVTASNGFIVHQMNILAGQLYALALQAVDTQVSRETKLHGF